MRIVNSSNKGRLNHLTYQMIGSFQIETRCGRTLNSVWEGRAIESRDCPHCGSPTDFIQAEADMYEAWREKEDFLKRQREESTIRAEARKVARPTARQRIIEALKSAGMTIQTEQTSGGSIIYDTVQVDVAGTVMSFKLVAIS